MRAVLVLALVGCAGEVGGSAGGEGRLEAALYPLSLAPQGTVSPGTTVDFLVTGGTPGETASLYFGRSPGAGSCPPLLGGTCLEVTPSTRVATGVYDGGGSVTLTYNARADLRLGARLYFQATDQAGGVGVLSPIVMLRAIPPDADEDGFDTRTDCDDSDPSAYPGAEEIAWDGTDQNCDGYDTPEGSIPVTALLPGDLVVTEVMQNPSAVGDTVGEWFEIENRAGVDVDLRGLTLADLGTDADMVDLSWVLPAGARAVFGVNGDLGLNGGVPVDFDFDTYLLGNSDDEIVLGNGTTALATVAWDGGPTWPAPNGASMILDPAWAGSPEDAAGWCVSSSAYGSGDLGTPGAANDACPIDEDGDGSRADSDCNDSDPDIHPGAPEVPLDGIDQDCDGADLVPDADGDGFDALLDCDDGVVDVFPGALEVAGDGIDQDCDGEDLPGSVITSDLLLPGDLVVTEFMQNPAAVADSAGEWFEILNQSGAEVELMGLSVADLGSESFTVLSTVRIPSGSYAVFAKVGDTGLNGGVDADYVWTTTFTLGNTDDEIVLTNGAGTIDIVAYDGGPNFPDPNGASASLHPTWLDAISNDAGASWCTSLTTFGAGDFGTPGAENVCPVDGDGDGSLSEVDCDDDDSGVYPGAPEIADDGIDQDCDGSDLVSPPDDDDDGHTADVDCDDLDPSVYPGATEVPGDGIDQNCDGVDAVPGLLEVEDLVEGDLIITEIMQNPNVISDSNGEWFEIWNASGMDVDLLGLVVADAFGTVTVGTSTVVPADGYALFGVDTNPKLNGGLTLVWDLGAVTLGNGGDSILLKNSTVTVDAVVYDGGPLFPDPAGASMSLDPDFWSVAGNDDGAAWCLGGVVYEANGNLGTPGAANPECP